MRLIDADAFKDYIIGGFECLKGRVYPQYLSLAQKMTKDFLIDIDEQPTVEKWISCSERLPKSECGESDNVYCTIYNTEIGDRRCKELYFDGSCWCYPTGEVFSGKWRVIAWQPLPEPYKGESND